MMSVVKGKGRGFLEVTVIKWYLQSPGPGVFICVGCHNKAPQAYEQQKCISHSSGGQEVQDQRTHGFWESGESSTLLPSWRLGAVSSGGDECCVLTGQKR